MKRIYTLIAAMALLVGTLTGCDSGTSTPPVDSGTNAPAAPATSGTTTN